MSMYSHGTSLYLKMGGMASTDSIMNMCSLFYYNIYKLVTTYCPNSASPRFYQLIDRLGECFDKYIQEFEEQHKTDQGRPGDRAALCVGLCV